jgi:protein-S-isoprenylcysteine O-methyltransferase Ste14
MGESIFISGVAASLSLLTLLARGLVVAEARIWPTPAPWAWQAILFWSLFRAVNLLVVALIVVDLPSRLGQDPVRVAGALSGALFLMLYGLALAELGRDNVYCGREGLVTGGIYRWSRNPQYATLIPAYIGLAVATGSLRAVALALLLAPIVLTMALLEEAWLREAYGMAYERYCSEVPRFYNLRLLGRTLRSHLLPPAPELARLRQHVDVVWQRARRLRSK